VSYGFVEETTDTTEERYDETNNIFYQSPFLSLFLGIILYHES